ncbi:MAG TPA: MlaD family protein [Telluria sp.]|nr:MlaD family protein [Telluria sp.]
MENRSHALMTGIFTLVLVAAAILAGIWFNRDTVERVPYMIATTQSIPGLNPQASVRYRGLEVGKVEDISFSRGIAGEILIRLALDPETPVTKTTYATLGYQGVTGIAYIQLDDDSTGSPRLPSSEEKVATLPLRPGFLDQLEKRGKIILDQTEQLTRRANQLLSDKNQQAVVTALDKIGKAADQFALMPAKLQPSIDRMPGTLASIDDAAKDVSKLADNWDRMATDLSAPNGPIERMSQTVDRVGGSVEAIASEVELQTLPHLVEMADEAKSSLRAVKRTANTLSNRPQSLLFGSPDTQPGPGEPGFTPPNK